MFRGPRIIYRGSVVRHLVPFAVLGGIYVGTQYYAPYAYVSAPAPVCSGQTEDGCELKWQDVPTEEGATETQCVAFCPADPPPPSATPAPVLEAVPPVEAPR